MKAGSPQPGPAAAKTDAGSRDLLASRLAGAHASARSVNVAGAVNGESYFERCTAGFSVGVFAAQRLCAVLISAMCVSACGKLPVWRPAPRIVLLGQQAEIVGDRDHAGKQLLRLVDLARQHIGVRQP